MKPRRANTGASEIWTTQTHVQTNTFAVNDTSGGAPQFTGGPGLSNERDGKRTMSIEHISAVFAANELTTSEAILLMAYCNYTDPHGYCWPGVTRLMAMTKMSRATVQRTNASLREKGLIKSVTRSSNTTGKQVTNLTRVNLSLLAAMRQSEQDHGDNIIEKITFESNEASPQVSQGPHPEAPGNEREAEGPQIEAPRGLTVRRGGPQFEAPRGLTVRPYPSVDPSSDPSIDPERAHAREDGAEPDWDQIEANLDQERASYVADSSEPERTPCPCDTNPDPFMTYAPGCPQHDPYLKGEDPYGDPQATTDLPAPSIPAQRSGDSDIKPTRKGREQQARGIVDDLDISHLKPWVKQKAQLISLIADALEFDVTSLKAVRDYAMQRAYQAETMTYLLGAFAPGRARKGVAECEASPW